MMIKEKMNAYFHKYKHAWVFLYGFIYMPWFRWLEQRRNVVFIYLHSPIDDLIPFCEYFIIPYLLWFVFIAFTGIWLFFKDVDGFYRYSACTVLGMTLFLIICTMEPNAIHLRPTWITRDNFCMDLVRMIWRLDTSTNVFPSLHVYNSICAATALGFERYLRKPGLIKAGGIVLAVLIIMSTMFLKQHSATDVVGDICMAALICPVVYYRETEHAEDILRQTI